eukprot:234297-Pyramimonas_sp.AAC.1
MEGRVAMGKVRRNSAGRSGGGSVSSASAMEYSVMTLSGAAGRPDPPMCCNIIYYVPVPRGRTYPSLGHSQDL